MPSHIPSNEPIPSGEHRVEAAMRRSGPSEQIPRVPAPETFFRVTDASNLPSILRDGLYPQLGDRAAATGEVLAQIYLFDSKDAALDAVGGWLGDAFDDDTELLSLSLPATAVADAVPTFDDPDGSWEWTATTPISSRDITVESDFSDLRPLAA